MKQLIKKILSHKMSAILSKMLYTLRIRWDCRSVVPLYRDMMIAYQYRTDDVKLEALSHSQWGQELYVLSKIFNDKQEGVFVEVGGNDPIRISNSYTLEQLGWTGVSFEPIDHIREKWEGVRSTPCLPYVIGNEEGFVEFEEIIASGGTFGLSGVAGYTFSNKDIFTQFKPEVKSVKKKQMRKLENVLNELNMNSIDILFIDVEGFELNVIKGIDLNEFDIKCICIKAVPFTQQTKELRKLICSKGYKLIANISSDEIYVKIQNNY